MALLIDLNLWGRFEDTVQRMINFFLDNLPEFFFSLVILMITIFIAKLVENRMSKYSGKLQKRMRVDATKFTLLKHISTGLVYVIGLILIFYTIPSLRALSTTLLASVGVLGLIVGIAAQDSFGNLISGIALVFFQPFRVGDLVTVDGNYGRVTDINLRQTTLITSDDRIIIIPNSVLNKETVINWTFDDTLIKWSFSLTFSNDSDIDLARNIMIEEAKKNPYVLTKEALQRKQTGTVDPVRVRTTDLSRDGTTLLLDFWVNDCDNAFSAEYDIRENIRKRILAEPTLMFPPAQMGLLTVEPLSLRLESDVSDAVKEKS